VRPSPEILSEAPLNHRETFLCTTETRGLKTSIALDRWKVMPEGKSLAGQPFEFGVHAWVRSSNSCATQERS
jgi:hypothetical protein